MMEFEGVLNGLLLGDGSLNYRNRGVRYTHTCKHKEYIQWVKKELEKYDLTFTPNIYEKPNGYGTGIGYQLYSHVDERLKEQYKYWYIEGKKVLPISIELEPNTLKHWNIGDGGFDSDKGYLRQIQIAAHSFGYYERQLLVDKLKSLGFKASNRKNGLICICKSSINDFLHYIGECPVNCYKYKWDVSAFQSKQPKYKSS